MVSFYHTLLPTFRERFLLVNASGALIKPNGDAYYNYFCIYLFNIVISYPL